MVFFHSCRVVVIVSDLWIYVCECFDLCGTYFMFYVRRDCWLSYHMFSIAADQKSITISQYIAQKFNGS